MIFKSILFLFSNDLLEIFAGSWPLFLIIIVFYFFIMRPQSQKAKKQDNFLKDLEKGAEVVTASGILGKINKIEDQIVTLQIDQKTFIRVTRNSISEEMTTSAYATTAK